MEGASAPRPACPRGVPREASSFLLGVEPSSQKLSVGLSLGTYFAKFCAHHVLVLLCSMLSQEAGL